jgi:2-polyprenyl-3-methyl-5-hydroxy-6-metoxy-1,4-benzoquinol methylase
MSMVAETAAQKTTAASDRHTARRAGRLKWALRHMFNTLGYSVARKDHGRFDCPALPAPSPDAIAQAGRYFANSFPISPASGMTEEEVARRAKDYFWHYPFQFGKVFIEADDVHFRGLDGRHRQRYFHLFPPLLDLLGGSLEGKTVLEIGCNAGFWTIQSRRAGASSVLGLDTSQKNVEQAAFIRDVIGLDGIEYRVGNAYEVSRDTLGEFDLTLFLGLLYHIDKPIEALERLYDVTRRWAVVDTTLARSDVPDGVPLLKLQEDVVHDQNFSNSLALVPSKEAVRLMLKHVGFREIYWIQNAGKDLPLDYLTHARMTFIAVK